MQEDMKMDQMTPTEKLEALEKLCKRIDDEFIQMAQLLVEIKPGRLWQMKGYETLKDYLESELWMNTSLANKMMRTYEKYVLELDLSAEEMQEIGLEKLHRAIPLLKDCDGEETVNMISQLKDMDLSKIDSQIKASHKSTKSIKDVFVEGFYEMWCSYLNCNKKELMLKLALFMQDRDPDTVRSFVKAEQRKFEAEIEKTHHDVLIAVVGSDGRYGHKWTRWTGVQTSCLHLNE